MNTSIANLIRSAGRIFGGGDESKVKTAPKMVRAKFDAAQYDSDNKAHYSSADDLSARAAASPMVRRTMRNRCRYEVANNSILMGLLTTISNDVVGRGAMLNVEEVGGISESDSDDVESKFRQWTEEVRLFEKLQTMRFTRACDGEAFAQFFTNNQLQGRVKLDIKLIEADQVASSYQTSLDPKNVDGIEIDDNGIPIAYHVLKAHPGDPLMMLKSLEHVVIPANQIIHWFRPSRPGQYRGIPEIAPSLRLFAQLRRYGAAVLTAAEQVANIAGVIYTDTAPDGGVDVEAGEDIPVERGTWRTMPAGWKIQQLQAEQPTTTYAMFKNECLSEAARCTLAPSLVVKGDASGYNYASGRLDMQSWMRAVAVDRYTMELTLLRPIFAAWCKEAVLIEGYLPRSFRNKVGRSDNFQLPPHSWLHEATQHVDPAKEASALASLLASGATNLEQACAENQLDWRKVIRQRGKELDLMKSLGVPTSLPGQPAPVDQSATDGGTE